jgi:hypothetical protein
MIPAEARGAWRDIETRLRPYVARRVASAAEVDDIVQEILVRVHNVGSGWRSARPSTAMPRACGGYVTDDAGRSQDRPVSAFGRSHFSGLAERPRRRRFGPALD